MWYWYWTLECGSRECGIGIGSQNVKGMWYRYWTSECESGECGIGIGPQNVRAGNVVLVLDLMRTGMGLVERGMHGTGEFRFNEIFTGAKQLAACYHTCILVVLYL